MLLIIPTSAHAYENACSDVFRPKTVVTELVQLQNEVRALWSSGKEPLARILYSEFQAKVKESLAAGVDLSSLFKQKLKNESVGDETRSKVDRARKQERELIERFAHDKNLYAGDWWNNIAVSADGQKFSYTVGKTIQITDLQTNQTELIRVKTDDHLKGIAASANLEVLAVNTFGMYGSPEGVLVYSGISGKILNSFPGETAILNRDGHLIAVSNGKSITVYRTVSGEAVMTFQSGRKWPRFESADFAFSRDGERLLVSMAQGDEIAACLEVKSGRVLKQFAVPRASRLSFLKDETEILVVDRIGGTAEIVDAKSGARLRSLAALESGAPRAVVSCPNGSCVAGLTAKGKGVIWHSETGEVLYELKAFDDAQRILVSADGQTVVFIGQVGPGAFISIHRRLGALE